MAEGRATYKIDVDARGAQASLDGVVKGALPKFEKLSGSINAAAGQIGGLGGVVGKTLGTFKQFGEAFMVGGPIGVGIAAGVVGIGYLVDKFGEGERAVKKFRDANREAMAGFVGDVERAAVDAEERLAAFGRTADQMRAERAALLLEASIEVGDDARKRAAELKADEEKYQTMLSIGQSKRTKMSIDDQRRFRDELKALSDTRDGRVEYLKQLDETAKGADASAAAHMRERDALAQLIEKEESRTKSVGKTKSGRTDVSAGVEQPRSFYSSSFDDDIARIDRDIAFETKEHAIKMRLEDENDEKASIARRAQLKIETAQKIAENEKKFADEEAEYRRAVEFALREERIKGNQWIVETMKDALLEYVQFSQSVILQSFDLTLDAIETIAAGQEVSLESMAAGFVKSIGRQLVAIGLTQTFEGTGHIIRGGISGDPRAIAGGLGLVALGTTAMSVGGAMAVTGAVASGMISGAAGGGGGGGGASSTMRPSRSREGVGGDDGGRSVTIVYNGGTFLGDSRQHERDRRRHMSNVFVPGVA